MGQKVRAAMEQRNSEAGSVPAPGAHSNHKQQQP